MSDRHSPAPRATRRKGNQHQHYASDSLTQQDGVQSDTNKSRQNGPNTPAKKGGNRQPSGPNQQARSGPRNTPDGKKGHHGVPQIDGAADIQSQARAGGSITPAKAAYAGPTFHASPAASTLPLPSRFYSKSVPSDQPLSGLQSRLDADTEKSSPRPYTAASEQESESDVPKPPPREESPLDIFFNAQKAERSGNRNSSPLAVGARAQPPSAASRRGPAARGTPQASKNMFMMELDGAGESSDALADIASPVPFKDRMQAVRNNSSPGHIPTQRDFEADRHAKTMELKKLLSMQSGGLTPGQGPHGQVPQGMPAGSWPDARPPQFQGQHNGQHGSPLRSHIDGRYAVPDSSSPFASPRGAPLGPYQGQQPYGGNPHQMHGFPGPSYGSPARQQQGQSPFAAELPGSAAHQRAPSQPQQHPGQYSQGQPNGQPGSSGIHNQITRMSQMEDSLRKILKLDEANGE